MDIKDWFRRVLPSLLLVSRAVFHNNSLFKPLVLVFEGYYKDFVEGCYKDFDKTHTSRVIS